MTEINNANTPAFVFDTKLALSFISRIKKIQNFCDTRLLFSIKALAIYSCIEKIVDELDGLSASSLFEAVLASNLLKGRGSVHITSPHINVADSSLIADTCDYIAFNSLYQFEQLGERCKSFTNIGLRINPGISFVKDKQYNPSRKYSKLGVPLEAIIKILNNGSSILNNVRGIHFHTNCESSDFNELLTTVEHLDERIPKLLSQVEWVNLGGGYLFESENLELLGESATLLKRKYGVDVFIEPGKGIVGKAGRVIASVVDIFASDGKSIAILDTTVNHMPEVFEYQYKPAIMNESKRGRFKYILAGASCLAGDLFGEYRFKEPLEIGSRVVFENMGAYTMVKAHMFNGINLPSVYIQKQDGTLELVKEYTYEDFKSRCGADSNVSI